jgi:hypothetical protein
MDIPKQTLNVVSAWTANLRYATLSLAVNSSKEGVIAGPNDHLDKESVMLYDSGNYNPLCTPKKWWYCPLLKKVLKLES